MTTIPSAASRTGQDELALASRGAGARTAFMAILRRDLFVTGKEFWVLLTQVALTPLFMLFIFAKVLGNQGYVTGEYGHILLPGIISLTAFLTALQSVAFPLVMEFGWTKEIEDRLLAPLPTNWVAVEKLVIASLRGLFAAAIMYPIGAVVLGSAPWHPGRLPLLVLVLVLGAWVGAGIGITLGTLIPPARISLMFGLIITPLMFTGATQYPWPQLVDMRWFQVITALNPLTYCAEGVRAALVPDVPHMHPWVCVLVLVVGTAVFTVSGILSFRKRAFS
jgi:ABC-2 type transport system permease protein